MWEEEGRGRLSIPHLHVVHRSDSTCHNGKSVLVNEVTIFNITHIVKCGLDLLN